jgi:hypothetical protein
MKRVKLPRDPNQRAKATLDLMLGNATPEPIPEKDAAAVESGRRGGLIGGKARAAKLSPERRSEIARAAARKRWGDRQAG